MGHDHGGTRGVPPSLTVVATLLVAAVWASSWGGAWLVGADAVGLVLVTWAHLQIAWTARRSGRRRPGEPWVWLSSANGFVVVAAAVGLASDLAVLAGWRASADVVGARWAGAALWVAASVLLCRGLARWGRHDAAGSARADWLNTVGVMLVVAAVVGSGAMSWGGQDVGPAGLAQAAAGLTLAAAALVLAASAWPSRGRPTWWLVVLFGVAGLAEAVGAGLADVPAARAAPVLVWALATHVMASDARAPESLRRRPTGLSAYTRVAASIAVLGVLMLVLDRVRAAWAGAPPWWPAPGAAWLAPIAGLGVLVVSAGLVRTVADVAAAAQLRRELAVDDLTGLASRRALMAELDGADCGRRCLVLANVDAPMESLNARFGHGIGHEALREVGRSLVAAAPLGATVARLDGSEFAVLLPGADGPAVDVAHALAQTLALGVWAGDRLVRVRARLGVAAAEAQVTGAELLRRAAAAMHGRPEGVSVYSDELERRHVEDASLLDHLRAALGGAARRPPGGLVVHYQPQVSLVSGEVTGVEALVRWQHPSHGLLAPAGFLGLVERDGLMAELTVHVLRVAATTCARWAREGRTLRASVNLSTSVLTDPGLLPALDQVLAETDLDPTRLVLEITETTLMADAERGLVAARGIADRGVGLSIDDYGTGYSSLAYLNDLPAQELKIDQAFTRRVATDPRTAKIIAATVDLAHSLDLRVVAEGVEDLRTQETLASLGCDEAQGYLHSPPLTPDGLERWLAGHAGRVAARRVC